MSRMNDEKGQSATRELRDSASEVGRQVREMGGQAKDAAREQYNNLRDKASEYYGQGKEALDQYTDSVGQYIQEKPIKAILIAAGIGALLGMLWKRS
ncbi:MAG TPA: hypothetical protein VG722_05240 [Tepidisphaeraceae bacterium]|nr:hypothetical protein [Tepidisphaeraceae bacterium]